MRMGESPLVVPIVEGDGETGSCPVLLPRLAVHLGLSLQFARSHNAHGRENLCKDGGVERFLRVASISPLVRDVRRFWS